MVDYTVFLPFILPALAMQGISIAYLLKIRPVIGNKAAEPYFTTNGLLLIYDFVIAYLIAFAANREGTQQIEIWGLYLAVIFPVGMGIGSIRKQRALYKAITPNSVGNNKFLRWFF